MQQRVQKFSLKVLIELLQLIRDSGITGIQITEGSFNNSIYQLRVLTPFKDALPNAIRVLKANGITDINAQNNIGWTPLYLAARDGQVEIAQALITAGADLNAQNNSGYTPLHGATNNGNTDGPSINYRWGGCESGRMLLDGPCFIWPLGMVTQRLPKH